MLSALLAAGYARSQPLALSASLVFEQSYRHIGGVNEKIEGLFDICAARGLTGVAAGEADAGGNYPEGSLNHRVATRLAELTELRKSFARPSEKKASTDKEAV